MPEGHTIHRMAKDHERLFRGQVVKISSPQGRFAEGASLVQGSVFRSATAHGKHLFYHLDGVGGIAHNIHIHLGLFGKFRERERGEAPSPNCRMRVEGGGAVLDLSGPTCCEVLTNEQVHAKRAQLGPDPLRTDGDAASFIERLSKRRIPIGAALLDQKVIAGLGNIYRAELLFEHRIDPLTPARSLKRGTAQTLWDTSVWWLRLGVQTNRIITTLREPPRTLRRIPRREAVMVYGHRMCRECESEIETMTVGNRKLYVCTTCQTRRQ